MSSIQANTFKESGLTSIDIPTFVTTIGQSAFEGCVSLKTVNYTFGFSAIGENAFKDCSVLNDLNLVYDKSIHSYVDLGLPSGTLWAECNVGANYPEDYGLYFAWGETQGYTGDTSDGRSFEWNSYKWCQGTEETITKYCTNRRYGTVDNKTELEPEDDAATVNWGSDWQMPSSDQLEELYNSSYTTTTWTKVNGVYGRKITSKKNGKSIFLPAAGYRHGSSLSNAGSNGDYWSRSLDASSSCYGGYLSFSSSDFDRGRYYRICGQKRSPCACYSCFLFVP